jgi:hypothetical protein
MILWKFSIQKYELGHLYNRQWTYRSKAGRKWRIWGDQGIYTQSLHDQII